MPHSRAGARMRRAGIEGAHGEIEARLPVALARGAVCDGGGALHRGELHELLRHQRPGERRRERVLPLVERARLQRRQDEPAREHVADVEHVRADGAGRERALAHLVQLAALAEIERDRDDLGAERLGQPRNGH